MNPTNNSRTAGADSNTTATATATVESGRVDTVTLLNGGFGYTSAPIVLFSSDGGGSGATASATVSNGSVTGVNLSEGGRGYTSAPTVQLIETGPALLTYEMLPNPNPLQVPVDANQVSILTLNVSNSSSTIFNCTALTVTLPGPSQFAQDLTDSFVGIGVQPPADQGGQTLWNHSRQGGRYTFTPVSDAAGAIGATGITFVFDNIMVNQSVGLCSVQVEESGSSSIAPYGTRDAPDIGLAKWPALFSMSGPSADPLEVEYGGNTTVNWSVIGSGISCTLLFDPDGNGIQQRHVKNVGTFNSPHLTNPSGSVVFTLQAILSVPGHSQPITQQQQISVALVSSPTADFSINPNPIVPGQPVTFTLRWRTRDVSSFEISANDGANGNSYTLPVPFSASGSYVVTPLRLNVVYTFTVLSTTTSRTKEESANE